MDRTLTFTLTVPESKRLIAKAISKLKVVRNALNNHTIIVANGITNAYIYEELTQQPIAVKSNYTAGIVIDGVACISDANPRMASLVLRKGTPLDVPWLDVIKTFGPHDVFIKGANSFDIEGNIGILLGGNGGGTIGKAYGHLRAAGSIIVTPIGYEKLIPSVPLTAEWLGRDKVDYSIGVKCGQFVLSETLVFTEVTALETLFSVKAIPIAAGGVQDCHGAITLAVRGAEDQVLDCLTLIKSLKGEPYINGAKRSCAACSTPCER